jgi:isopenicillin N synthase-like dioxygenase
MPSGIPVLDISPWYGNDALAREKMALEFDAACREWGFLIIAGHRIGAPLIESIRDVTRSFFDLPIEQKLQCDSSGRPGGRGYYRVTSKSHARTLDNANAPGDLRETFFAGMEPVPGDTYTSAPGGRAHFASNVWPSQLMRSIWEQYFKECDLLARDLLHICASALALPENWFDDKIDRPISTLTAQHYPKLERPPEPGQLRSGAHTDFGTLTLLMTEDRPGGLQVMGTDGVWRDVRPEPNAYIVNLGDMMAQWTNDRWRSTLHRVINPPLDAGAMARRLSIVYFHTPNYDAVIECIPSCSDAVHPPKYAAVLAGEHLSEKLRKTNSVSKLAS